MVSVAKKNDKLVVIVVAISFFASLMYAFTYQIHPVVDAKAYHNIAVNIISGNGFRESATGDILFDRSIQRAGPAYEYFLAGLYSVFGVHLSVIWIAQAILHALSAWFLYRICRLIWAEHGYKIGLITAAIFGFHPDLIEISAMLMTETLYLFLTILTIYFFVKVFLTQKWQWSSALAVALAAGILARPPLVLFIPIISFLYVTRKEWWQLMLFICLVMLCLLPWTWRNYQIYHQFIPTTLIGEYNIWVGNTLAADGGQLASGFNPFDEYAAKNGYITIGNEAKNSFKNFVTEHPGKFVKLTAIRTVRYFSLIRPMGFWFYQTGISQVAFVFSSGVSIIFLFITGFTGMIKLAQTRNKLFYYIIILALTAPVVLLPTVVQSRYRFQIYPFLALGAGYALMTWLKEKNCLRDRALQFTVIFLGLITVLDIFLNIEVILSRFATFL